MNCFTAPSNGFHSCTCICPQHRQPRHAPADDFDEAAFQAYLNEDEQFRAGSISLDRRSVTFMAIARDAWRAATRMAEQREAEAA